MWAGDWGKGPSQNEMKGEVMKELLSQQRDLGELKRFGG